MKTILFSAAFLLISRLGALNPVSTYTFVDPCTPFVVMNPVPGTHGCFSFTVANGLLPGQTPGTYHWKFGDGATADGTVVAHCYDPKTMSAVYTGTVYHDSPVLCGAQITERAFTVSVPSIPSGSCVVNSPDVLVSAQSVTVEGGVTIPEAMRSFNYGDEDGFEVSPYHTYTGCGPYVITIKLWDMNLPDDICYAYHAVNFACKDITTSLSENYSGAVKVFPNPCDKRLFIESDKIPIRVTVIDILGKTRPSEIDGTGQKLSLYTGDLDHGIFFVKIEYLDRSADVFRIMKD